MLIRTLTAFLLFNNPQIPMQNNADYTIKKAWIGIDSKFIIRKLKG